MGEGARIWGQVQRALARRLPMEHAVAEHRYGKPILVQPRLGQGAFRLLVTEAYQRRCAVTGERTLPVLDAAHIRPYAELGPHKLENGILLRKDLHALFDAGPAHPDNRGLRRAMQTQLPMVWFWRVQPGQYLAAFPVFIVGDHPEQLTFDVQVGDPLALAQPPEAESFVSEDRAAIRREYVTAIVRRRVHQQAFRARVIEAYRTHCALCRLRHQELLDAAHITADTEATGEPVVSNGLSLCKLHHAAFDRHFLTVRPDYTIEVRRSILEETDGPMLLHGLQGLHDRPIYLPRESSLQPDRDRLEERYAAFMRSIV